MLAPNVQPLEYLPQINSRVETVRLACGSLIRLCLHSAVYYGARGVISDVLLGNRGAFQASEREAICYVLSMLTETGVSMLWTPIRYLAAVNTPRFLLDYLLTRWSEVLRFVDRFHPGRFASYALYAFASEANEEWNLNFFAWQVPSVVLTLGKLILRRIRLGSKNCRTKRILGILFFQIVFRAYMSTFSVMIPEQGSEAAEAMLVTIFEGLCTAYLARHTWPFVYNESQVFGLGTSCSHSSSEGGTATVTSSTDETTHAGTDRANGSGSEAAARQPPPAGPQQPAEGDVLD